MPQPTPRFSDITSRSSIGKLAQNPLLDELVGCELLVLLRIVASAGDGSRTKITNGALRPGDPRTVVRALRRLEELGLVRLHYEAGGAETTRTIEVCR